MSRLTLPQTVFMSQLSQNHRSRSANLFNDEEVDDVSSNDNAVGEEVLSASEAETKVEKNQRMVNAIIYNASTLVHAAMAISLIERIIWQNGIKDVNQLILRKIQPEFIDWLSANADRLDKQASQITNMEVVCWVNGAVVMAMQDLENNQTEVLKTAG